jgi:hypothetical protein
MKNAHKGSLAVVTLSIIIVLLVIAFGAYVYLNKKTQVLSDTDTLSFTGEVSKNTNSLAPVTNATTETASGIIKSVYTKSGKNYIDIDYVELTSNWVPNGVSGPAYKNNNPEIRTLEISSKTKFIVEGGISDKNSSTYTGQTSITFSEFKNIFTKTSYENGVKILDYRTMNPWDIVLTNGAVTQIKEHYLS